MKKLFNAKTLLFVMMLFILVLAACGSSGDTNNQGNSNSGTTETGNNEGTNAGSDGKKVIGFSQVGAESEFRTANTESVLSALEEAGYEVNFSDAQQKQENQLKAIRSFIAQDVDAIVLAPVVETGFETVLQEAKDAEIPVFLVDRSVDVEADDLWVSFLGSDFVEEGRKAARWTLEEFEGEEDVKIVELQGTVGSAPAIDRKVGFEEILGDDLGDKFEIINSQSGNFTRTEGKEVMEAFLKSNGDEIDLLFAHNDDMAIGAIQAIKEYGLDPGKDIKVIGMDAVRGAFEAMIAGEMNVTIECNPLFGPQLADLIDAYFAGEEIDNRVVVEEGMFEMHEAEELLPTREY